eukprot:Rhum_TRINITY_DN15436_c1_g1::Rhum_TRINITY_DN15436_c1_g1_i1::g.156921::m.156921
MLLLLVRLCLLSIGVLFMSLAPPPLTLSGLGGSRAAVLRHNGVPKMQDVVVEAARRHGVRVHPLAAVHHRLVCGEVRHELLGLEVDDVSASVHGSHQHFRRVRRRRLHTPHTAAQRAERRQVSPRLRTVEHVQTLIVRPDQHPERVLLRRRTRDCRHPRVEPPRRHRHLRAHRPKVPDLQAAVVRTRRDHRRLQVRHDPHLVVVGLPAPHARPLLRRRRRRRRHGHPVGPDLSGADLTGAAAEADLAAVGAPPDAQAKVVGLKRHRGQRSVLRPLLRRHSPHVRPPVRAGDGVHTAACGTPLQVEDARGVDGRHLHEGGGGTAGDAEAVHAAQTGVLTALLLSLDEQVRRDEDVGGVFGVGFHHVCGALRGPLEKARRRGRVRHVSVWEGRQRLRERGGGGGGGEKERVRGEEEEKKTREK